MQTLPRQDEHRPRLYLGKDEVECGITAAMTRGGPAVRTREMGKYFQAALYLLSVCYRSKFIEVTKLESLWSGAVIEELKRQFGVHGIPAEVVTDNGPQLSSSEF